MKKFFLALTAAAAVCLGTAGIADAYPLNGQSVVVADATVAAGAAVTVTANCTVGETVTVTLGGQSATAVCVAIDSNNPALGGTATVTVNGPTAVGSHTGSVTGTVSGALGSFTVTVAGVVGDPVIPVGGLPATGSNGTGTMTMLAGGLLVVGLGLFGVATVRRRHDMSAA